MRTTLLFAFIVGILSFQSPQQAHACSCIAPGSTEEEIAETAVIFSATVDDIRADGEWGLDVSMTVDTHWKGLKASEQNEVTVQTATNSAACGYAFEEGESYLVYGERNEEGDEVHVGLCSATKLLARADEDLALLSGDEPWACTMDAKQCPDGSYVGRQGPTCEFAPCPDEKEPNCQPYVCANGNTHPRCAEDGSIINYFAPPCHTDGGEAGAPFDDVSSDHANADAIFYVKSEGIVEGYDDGTYRADATINRAEFVKILMETFEDDGRVCKIAPFADVDQSAWYATYAHKARCHGIVEGYPDGSFKPANGINFVEAAKILVKTFGLEASTTIPACDGDCSWYRSYVLMLEMRGAIPLSITRFDQPITRGEMAEMIFRLKTGKSDKPSQTYEGLGLRFVEAGDVGLPFSFSYPASWGMLQEHDTDASYGYRLWDFPELHRTPFSVSIYVTPQKSGLQFTTGPCDGLGCESDTDFETYREALKTNKTTDGGIRINAKDYYSPPSGSFHRSAEFFAENNHVFVNGAAGFHLYLEEYDRRVKQGGSPSITGIVREDISWEDEHPMDTVFWLYPDKTVAEQRFFLQVDAMIHSMR